MDAAAHEMQEGLGHDQVRERLHVLARMDEIGQRAMAFYLVEMEARGLHQRSGYSSTLLFAELELQLDRRRTRELLAVGRALLELPAVDRALCDQEIGWTKARLLTQVAVPEHEAAWIERAKSLTCRELALEVRLTKKGAAPRAPGDRKGLREVRFRVDVGLSALVFQMLELARAKLSAERGEALTDEQVFKAMAELVLSTDESGEVPGRTRVDASLYRVSLVGEGAAAVETSEPHLAVKTDVPHLAVVTDQGAVPIGGSDTAEATARTDAGQACVACDAPEAVDGVAPPTPPALRSRVLRRDGHMCRCCRSRRTLHAHHIRYRSEGGPTTMANLITLCDRCHALVHENLLVLAHPDGGERSATANAVCFQDAEGRRLRAEGRDVPPTALIRLAAPAERSASARGPLRPAPSATFDGIPEAIDRNWWRAHASLLSMGSAGCIAFIEGTPEPVEESRAERSAPPGTLDLTEIEGQSGLLERLALAAEGARLRGRTFPHTLFVGPPGTGKSMFARAIAERSAAAYHVAIGPTLKDTHAVVGLLAGLEEGDVLFLDEIHAMPRAVQETLYLAMGDGHLPLTLRSGARCRSVRFDLPQFTLVAATSEGGELPQALASRFGIQEDLARYAVEDLAAIVRRAAERQGVQVDADAAVGLATHARGTPREALRLLERVLDVTAWGGSPVVHLCHVDAMLEALGYDQKGLRPMEQRYLALLQESPVPIPLSRIAMHLGFDVRRVARDIEPHLFEQGLIRMTPRGRVAA